jgi:hypothetical protein
LQDLRRSFRWRWSALCLVGALGASLAACGGHGRVVATRAPATANPATSAPATSTQPGTVVLNGNFADPAQAWPTQAGEIPRAFVSGATPSLTINGNTYTVAENGTGFVTPMPDFGATTPVDLTNVAVSTTVQPNTIAAGDGVGVVCRASMAHAYVFTVGPGGQPGQLSWSISAQGTPSRPLGSGTVAAPSQPGLTIEGDCVGGAKQSSKQLTLSLDGQVIGRATDAEISAPFAGLAGLRVSSAHGGTSVTFSSFQVRVASAS